MPQKRFHTINMIIRINMIFVQSRLRKLAGHYSQKRFFSSTLKIMANKKRDAIRHLQKQTLAGETQINRMWPSIVVR